MHKSHILLIEDMDQERAALSETLKGYGYRVTAVSNGVNALEKLKGQDYDLVISDLKMPELDGIELLRRVNEEEIAVPVIIISGYGTVESAVEAMKLGAFDFILKPFAPKVMNSVVERAIRCRVSSSPGTDSGPMEPLIITRNRQMLDLLDLAKTVADSKAAVLIQGESGTGKELFARFIHNQSSRRNKTFVAVNCAALPEGLLESELFGHEKGAFTGAVSRKLGKFELARGSTILLDEISEMNIQLQAKLLRVLQESEVDRVGGQHPIPIDVRVIGTTNQDIESAIEAKKFRADLYYRLNVIPIRLPPLRDRKDDIPLLADYFIKKYNKIDGRDVKGLTKDAAQTLMRMHWPGNVRELENVMERAVLLCGGDLIDKDALFAGERPKAAGMPESSSIPAGSLKEMEKRVILETLDQTNGNRTHAAEILGISVRTLRNKLNEYREKMEML
ncbi:MAG: sigma-54-dependent Fis family transcriptional regulator [Deltaproteobacteria bacterium]|nr:sigma-54-dependent Fis family transcriptional regulator [Deltaproteobacteria bacterium]MBW2018947.1 sigma-54-dependent Fis family transcriptional regulator [Deltaproteobacteria bacterium]MBW2073162.1 sigma-54-dependent Fis family transcriptional regulator [Deltaproteobacteria bacterium]